MMIIGWGVSQMSRGRGTPIPYGVRGVVTRGGPRLPQLDDVPLLLDDANRHTNNGIRRVPLAGVTVRIAPGTPVRLIEAGPRGSLVQVSRGKYYGRIGWVPQGYAWPENPPPSPAGERVARRIN